MPHIVILPFNSTKIKSILFCLTRDETATFINYLGKESDHLKSIKDNFVAEFSMQDYNYLLNSWKEKLTRSKEGHHRWGIMYAEKKKL